MLRSTDTRDAIDVLVLDDDEDVRLGIKAALRRACTVRCAARVEEAWNEIQRRQPDVLLCDYWLGDGTSGPFLASVAATCSRSARILVSGSSRYLWEHLVAAGLVDDVIHKPFAPHELLATIERAVRTRSHHSERG